MSNNLGSFFLGMVVCWLFNLVELGVGVFVFSITEKQMAAAYVLVYAIGLVQVGYVVPLWRVFRRRELQRTASGVLTAAIATLVLNLIFDYKVFGVGLFHFWS